jgi:hypothetical protein
VKKIVLNIVIAFCLLINHNAKAVPVTATEAVRWLGETTAWSLILSYALHQYMTSGMGARNDGAVESCVKQNAAFFSKKTHEFVQQQIKQCGVAAPVMVITGAVSFGYHQFAIIMSQKYGFSLNIPPADVQFLNNALERSKQLSAQEQEKMDEICFTIAHEMNHVKKMIAGSSYGLHEFQWCPVTLAIAAVASIELLMFHTSDDTSMPFIKYGLPGNLLLFFTCIGYVIKKDCDEEYACDVEGIDDIKLLRAGKKWMLTDCKAIVQEVLAKRAAWIQNLYKKYPNVVCSLVTRHPHPDARAQAIENKIAALEYNPS